MRVSAIREDNVVVVNGVGRSVDLTAVLPTEVRAVQWDTTAGKGHVEYTAFQGSGANTRREDVLEGAGGSSYVQPLLDAWTAAAPAGPTVEDLAAAELAAKRAAAADALLERLLEAEAAKPDGLQAVKEYVGLRGVK